MAHSLGTILYIEDEPNDVYFMQQAFEQAGIQNPVQVLHTGQDALAYLSGTGEYSDRALFPIPVLVLLDLGIPEPSGFQVLKWIRTTPAISSIPVIPITSSDRKADMQRASLLGANGYLVKPEKPEQFLEMIVAFKNYWLRHDSLTSAPTQAISEE